MNRFVALILKLSFITIILIIFLMIYTKVTSNGEEISLKSIKMKSDTKSYSRLSKFKVINKLNDEKSYNTVSITEKNFKVKNPTYTKWENSSAFFPSKEIPLVIVLCNNTYKSIFSLNNDHKLTWPRQEQQLRAMFGSLLLFSKVSWRVVVLIDSSVTFSNFLNLFLNWPKEYKSRIYFEKHKLKMPKADFINKWRPCSWIKIFLVDLLPQFDRIVYIDTDVLFLGPVEDLWLEFNKLENESFLGIGAEPWYFHENEDEELHTIGGKWGLNTGILLMDLKKSRSMNFNFSEEITNEIKHVKNLRHDQDVVNSLLNKNPKYLYELSSRYNFLPSVCTVEASCPECQKGGILILHGADGSFYSDIEPRFNVIFATLYEEFKSASFDSSRVSIKIQSQLEFMEYRRQDGVCKLYSNFTSMILKYLPTIT